MSLNWFNTTIEGDVQSTSYTGNFKVIGDIEVTGLVRRNGEVFESITPQWSNTNTPGKIYYNLDDTTILVGIGTSDPQTPTGALLGTTLAVAGNISYTGDIYRNGARLDFGFGAWTGDKSATVFYGGSDDNRIGVGEGFVKSENTSAPSISAKATVHAWSLSSYNTVNADSWNHNMGIRVGPHKVNSPFLQSGVMEDANESISSINRNWSWIQSAKYTLNTTTPLGNRLMVNPAGGNVGLGVKNISNIDAALSVSSFDQFASLNGFRRAISLAPETHDSLDSNLNYGSLIYSKTFGLGFRDQTDADGGLYIMTHSGSISFKNPIWQDSVHLAVKSTGNVGIGTANPRLKLSISSSSTNGLLISNPQLAGGLDFGLQLSQDGGQADSEYPITINGLALGPLGLTSSTITNKLIVHDTGIRVRNRVETSEYYIGSNPALIGNTLGNTIINSSLTSVGTLTSLRVGGETKLDTDLRFNNHRIRETNDNLVFSLSNNPKLTISNSGIDVSGNITQNGADILPFGSIVLWSGTVIPPGWALCNGLVVNGFSTPDLRGRFVLGANPDGPFNQQNTDGLDAFGGNQSVYINSHTVNTRGGTTQHQMTEPEMPSHVHGFCANINAHRAFDTSDGNEGYNTGGFGCTITNPTGGNQPHNNMPVYYVLAYIMKVGGTTSNPTLPGSDPGGQTGTPEQVYPAKATAWLTTTSSGAIRYSGKNISSISRISTGAFQINFLTPFLNDNWTVTTSPGYNYVVNQPIHTHHVMNRFPTGGLLITGTAHAVGAGAVRQDPREHPNSLTGFGITRVGIAFYE